MSDLLVEGHDCNTVMRWLCLQASSPTGTVAVRS